MTSPPARDGLPDAVPLERLTKSKTWRVSADFDVTVHGALFTVKKGFLSDLDSVPRLPLFWLFFKGHAVASAVFHDWLYATAEVDRATADDYFWHLLLIEGMTRHMAFLMWSGVRAGGWVAWNRHRRRAHAGQTPAR